MNHEHDHQDTPSVSSRVVFFAGIAVAFSFFLLLAVVGLIVWLGVRHVDSQSKPPEMSARPVLTPSAATVAITPIDPEQFDLQREDFAYRFTTITNELHRMQVSDFPRWRSAARTNVWSIVLSNRNEAAAQLDAWTAKFAEPLMQLVQSNRFLVEGVPPGAITAGLFDPDALEPWAETDLLIAPSNQLAHIHGELQEVLLLIGLQYTNSAERLAASRERASQMIEQAVPEITSVRRQLGRFLTGNERAGFGHADLTLATHDDEVAKELLERLVALRRTLYSHPLNQGQQLHNNLRDFAPIDREVSDAGMAQMQDLAALLGRAGEFRDAYRELTNNWQAVTTDRQAEIERRRKAIEEAAPADDTISSIIGAEFGGTYPFSRRSGSDSDNPWVEAFRFLNNRPRDHWDRTLVGETLRIPVWRADSTAMPEAQFNATKEAIDRLGRSEAVADQLLANVMLHSLFWVQAESRVLFDKTPFRRDLERFLSARGRTWPRIDR